MKILIYGVSRSGTTSLNEAISNQGYFAIGEPFNEWFKKTFTDYQINRTCEYPIKDFFDYDNVVVKSLALQKPINWEEDITNFQLKFISDFDKVIILDRKNLKEHRESFLHLYWRIDKKEPVMQKWTMDSIPKKYKEKFEIDNRYYDLELQKEQLTKISKLTNIPITYYEDLYGEDRTKSLKIIKSWGLKLDANKLNDDLNPIHKLRQKKILI